MYEHLLEVEQRANKLYNRLLEQYKVKWGITEELKEKEQMEWIRQLNTI
ncbi:MAG: TnpV protein [Thomasclavelia spiroformis]